MTATFYHRYGHLSPFFGRYVRICGIKELAGSLSGTLFETDVPQRRTEDPHTFLALLYAILL